MTTMECPRGHGPMVRRVLGGTPEQRWAGTWWSCPAVPRCWSSVLVPSAELLAHLREQAPPCVTCGLAAPDWPVDDPLYRLGRHQCPGCIRADIDGDMAATRREDQ